jgi:carotenoid cleavage dioxygenase-like enzyme
MDSTWLVMDRRTNATRVVAGNDSFVNNHFWNCFEDPSDGAIVVETVATTSAYLDMYFADVLAGDTDWASRFQQPLRCRLPPSGDAGVRCKPLSPAFGASAPFDYPTFNPLFKMRPYRFFYAIGPSSAHADWFDRLIKVDVSDASGGRVAASWSAPGVFLTEADFVPRANSTAQADEDDGVLVSVLYNASTDRSSLAVFDATDLSLIGLAPLGGRVPFHAHGIVCRPGEQCFSNP